MKKMLRKYRITILLLFLLTLLYAILYKLFIPHVSAFGCFDDCFNFMGGYFITKGKTLYSEIFFNHQMLMAYISAAIQLLLKPENIYHLVLVHRISLLLFGFAFSALLIVRFGIPAFATIIFYELTKFYLFGNRFLAEAFIVYPLMFMLGLVYHLFTKRKLRDHDYIIAAICTWFVIFMREPYIPLTLVLFALIIIDRKLPRAKLTSIILFGVLSLITIITTPIQDYFFNVVTLNQQTVFQLETQDKNLLLWIAHAFFYPLFLFLGGEWNHFRYILILLSITFLCISIYLTMYKKQYRLSVLIVLLLGLANIRPVDPGHIFYSAFHMIAWYGLFLFSIFLMLEKTFQYAKKLGYVLSGILTFVFIFAVFWPRSYIYEKAYPHETFITNYGKELQAGEGFRKLSNPGDTLFLDGFDDLIYWQADRISPYKYSWYTSVMGSIPRYTAERLLMFKNTPPDFYYGSCPKETSTLRLLPRAVAKDYIRIYNETTPTCMFVHKKKLPEISQEQWGSVADLGLYLPDNEQDEL